MSLLFNAFEDAVAVLEFLAAAAGTGLVAADLGGGTYRLLRGHRRIVALLAAALQAYDLT